MGSLESKPRVGIGLAIHNFPAIVDLVIIQTIPHERDLYVATLLFLSLI